MTTNRTADIPVVKDIAAEPKHKIVVRGEHLLAKVRELIHQGNVRRIIVMSDDGTTILEIPLTAGVVGAIIAPVLVAIGAIAALANDYTLLIEATNAPTVKARLNGGEAKPRTARPKVG